MNKKIQRRLYRQFNKSQKVRNLYRSLFFDIIHKSIYNILEKKYDDNDYYKIFKLSKIITYEFLKIGIPKILHKNYNDKNTLINEVLELIRANKQLDSYRLKYKRINRYILEKFEADSEFQMKILFDKRIRIISETEFFDVVLEGMDLRKSNKSFFINKKKESDTNYTISKIKEFNFSQKNILTLATIFSILFFCLGFLYNWVYLGYFGIELQNFFTLNDYVSTSIGKIFITFTSFIFPLFYFFVINYFFPGEPFNSDYISRSPKRIRFWQKYNVIQFIVFPVLIIITLYFKQFEIFINLLWIFSFLIIMKILIKYIYKFEKPDKLFFISSIFIVFICILFANTSKDIYNVIKSDLTEIKKYEITLHDNTLIDENECILLSSNSQYYFFYDKNKNIPVILPSSEIKSIKYIGKKRYKNISKLMHYFINTTATDNILGKK